MRQKQSYNCYIAEWLLWNCPQFLGSLYPDSNGEAKGDWGSLKIQLQIFHPKIKDFNYSGNFDEKTIDGGNICRADTF